MSEDFSHLPDVELRSMQRSSRIVLRALALGIRQPPGAEETIQRLATSPRVSDDFHEMAAKDPVMMAEVLSMSAIALINVLAMDNVGAELVKRAAPEN